MRLLLDTHAFLWMLDDTSRLSSVARIALATGDNELFFALEATLTPPA